MDLSRSSWWKRREKRAMVHAWIIRHRMNPEPNAERFWYNTSTKQRRSGRAGIRGASRSSQSPALAVARQMTTYSNNHDYCLSIICTWYTACSWNNRRFFLRHASFRHSTTLNNIRIFLGMVDLPTFRFFWWWYIYQTPGRRARTSRIMVWWEYVRAQGLTLSVHQWSSRRCR